MRKDYFAKTKSGGIWISIGSGLLVLFGGIGCCGLPIIGGLLTVLGVTSGFIASIKPWQPFFVAIAVVSLAYEFYKAYRPLSERSSCCEKRTGRRLLLWCLTIAMGSLITLQYTFNPDSNTVQLFNASEDYHTNSTENRKTITTQCCSTPIKITNGVINTDLSQGQKMKVTVLDINGGALGVHMVSCCKSLDITKYDDGRYILQIETPQETYKQPILLRKNSCCKM